MPTVIHVPDEETFEEMIAEREKLGINHHDEVWDGEYVVMNVPANRHQRIVGRLTTVLEGICDLRGGDDVLPGVNVTDRDNWKSNYRVPDVAVFLAGNPAEDRGTHFFGGPDLAIEILSPRDRTYEKFAFYAAIGTRELIVISERIDAAELYRLRDGVLQPAGTLSINEGSFTTESVAATWALQQTDRLTLLLTGAFGERRKLLI